MSAGPIAETFDFWPFDIPPGTEFLLVYAVIALVGVILAKVVQVGLLSMLGPTEAEAEREADYRKPGARRTRLVIGVYPSIDDVQLLAYLRARQKGVAESIIVQAMAEGWLKPSQPFGTVTIYPMPNETTKASRELAANLHATTATAQQVELAASRVAERISSELARELVELGLLHAASTRAYALFAYASVGALVFAIGAIRALRGLELNRPVGFLMLEVVAVGLVLLVAARPKRVTDKGDAYLRWIGDSTHSLRQDVAAGRNQRPTDVALAGAMTGLVAAPLIATLWPTTASAWTSSGPDAGSSVDYSSCSSSSCGGGGGCGSSGCGGGGGCGG